MYDKHWMVLGKPEGLSVTLLSFVTVDHGLVYKFIVKFVPKLSIQSDFGHTEFADSSEVEDKNLVCSQSHHPTVKCAKSWNELTKAPYCLPTKPKLLSLASTVPQHSALAPTTPPSWSNF